jgi:hypothetical protein
MLLLIWFTGISVIILHMNFSTYYNVGIYIPDDIFLQWLYDTTLISITKCLTCPSNYERWKWDYLLLGNKF